ncbi:MAG: hypothetical protein Q4A82_06165 [Corynebacterium sp.]|nr:hypothetical protein [Corynebacterium sp.]
MSVNEVMLVSNGTLLNEKMISRLESIQPQKIQISIDGDRKNHDQFRSFKTGSGSYDQIFENLQAFSQIFSSISLRANVTPDNVTTLNHLIEDLSKNILMSQEQFSLMFCPIESIPSFSLERKTWSSFLDGMTEAIKYAVESGFKVVPQSHINGCSTCANPESSDGLVITTNGLLYSCWDSAGQTNMEIGRLSEGYDKELVQKNWVSCGYNGDLSLTQRQELLRANLIGIFS